jgi:hypothetical protein
VRDRRLINVESQGEVAHAHLVVGARKGRQNRYSGGITKRFEQRRLVGQVAIIDRRFGTAPLYRHISILAIKSANVHVARGCGGNALPVSFPSSGGTPGLTIFDAAPSGEALVGIVVIVVIGLITVYSYLIVVLRRLSTTAVDANGRFGKGPAVVLLQRLSEIRDGSVRTG